MQYKDEFYKNQYQTTDFLMEYVRSVQDLGSVISVSYTHLDVYKRQD